MRAFLDPLLRRFRPKEHIRNVLRGPWIELVDEAGLPLAGVKGRMGAAAHTVDGRDFGADLIEMQPGSAFLLHDHPGDHILYVIHGSGVVHADGLEHAVAEGDTIFIPAEYPHGVKTHDSARGPLVFLAVGHPHRPLDARDRMRAMKPSVDNDHRHE